MAHLYWIVTSLVLAIVVHVGYVLVAPSYAIQRSLGALVAETGVNRFFILRASDQARLFPAFPPQHIFGACAFDLRDTKVELTGNMPEGLWTLTIYSASGDVFYTLNDTQSGTARFTVSLSLAPSFIEMVTKAGTDEAVNISGWDVQANEPTGLAVFWIPVNEAAMRPGVIKTLGSTECRPDSSPS